MTRVRTALALVFLSFAVALYAGSGPVHRQLPAIVCTGENVSMPGIAMRPCSVLPDTNKTPLMGISVGTDTTHFTPEQDSAFARAMRIHVSSRIRFWHDITLTDSAWYEELRRLSNLPEVLFARNMEMNPKDLIPTGQEVLIHQKQYSPGIPPDYIPNISQATLSIPFSMGGLLGYEEDVTPEISYSAREACDVSIVIYAVGGDVVAHPLKAEQSAGGHKYTWNGRDDNGTAVKRGDYIAEVYIGDKQIVRKHIKVQ